MNVFIEIKDKVESDWWSRKTSLSEGINAYKVYNDYRLKDLGEWGLDYVLLRLGDGSMAGYCTVGFDEDEEEYTLYGLYIELKHQNQGLGEKFIRLIVQEYVKKRNSYLKMSTRNECLKKILVKMNFELIDKKVSEYSGREEELWRNKCKRCDGMGEIDIGSVREKWVKCPECQKKPVEPNGKYLGAVK